MALPDVPPCVDVDSGGRRCRVRRLGSGPRLVLLHGGPGLDHTVLLPLATELADTFEVWLPDLPGHGVGADDEAPRPGFHACVSHLGAWLKHLPGPPPILGGHSLGAWLSRELVRRRVVRPSALLLLSPPAVNRPRKSPARPVPNGPGDPEALRRALLRELRADAGDLPSDELVAALALGRFREAAAFEALLSEFLPLLDRPPAKCAPGCPTLVLGGTRDRTCPTGSAAVMAQVTEGATLRMLRDVGHYPWSTDARLVADEIRQFLAPISSGGA